MASFTATLARIAFGPPPEVLCANDIWQAGVAELRRRTLGRRESGAFLLGSKGRDRRIEEFIFYDDIDPDALKTGMVKIDGRRLGALWAHCQRTGRAVVADIHVHPGGFAQSDSDRANPIIAEIGHIAFILPHYAARGTIPGRIGVYKYRGNRQWCDHSFDFWSPLHIGWWPWA